MWGREARAEGAWLSGGRIPGESSDQNATGDPDILGDWSKAKLPEDYGVHAIPAIFLIGPNGKILRAGLQGEAIKSAVAEALGKTGRE